MTDEKRNRPATEAVTRRAFVVGGLLATTFPALAYPARQVSFIVPFAPGASADGIARILGGYLSDALSTTMVIDNRPGGGGANGLIAISRAPADGQTIGVGATGAIAINPHVEGAVPFDPLRQLTPIAKLIDIPLVLVANPSAGLRNVGDVVTKSKATAGGINCGSTGVNSSQHLSIEVLKQRTGAQLSHIPYRGSAPAVVDLLSGQVPLACVDLTSAAEHIKARTLIALGVTSAKRFAVSADVPTFSEQGVADFDIPAWIGLFGPPQMDAATVGILSNAVAKGLADADIREQIERLVCEPAYLDGPGFRTFISSQSDQMKEYVKLAQGK